MQLVRAAPQVTAPPLSPPPRAAWCNLQTDMHPLGAVLQKGVLLCWRLVAATVLSWHWRWRLQRGFQTLVHAKGRLLWPKLAHRLAGPAHDELSEVPFDHAASEGHHFLELLKDGVCVGTVHLDLVEQREADTVVVELLGAVAGALTRAYERVHFINGQRLL